MNAVGNGINKDEKVKNIIFVVVLFGLISCFGAQTANT